MLISCLTFWLQNYFFRYPALGNGQIIKKSRVLYDKDIFTRNEKSKTFSKLKS